MDTETTSAFRFRLYWLFIVSALQDAGGYAISRQNNLELHLGCHTWSLRDHPVFSALVSPAAKGREATTGNTSTVRARFANKTLN